MSIRAQHPDWEHRLWTDSDNRDFIAGEYGWFLDTYDAYRHEIERVDAVRYFILYSFGGVYLDLDMDCLKPLDALVERWEPSREHYTHCATTTVAADSIPSTGYGAHLSVDL